MKIGNISESAENQVLPGVNAGLLQEEKETETGAVAENKSTVAAMLEISQAAKKMYQEQAENSKEAGDAIGDLAKIMEVARRISRGDKVPARDEKKLMEHSMELYQMAKQAAMLSRNKDRKEHDSLFEEEEDSMVEKLRQLNREDGEAISSGGTVSSGMASGSGASAPVELESVELPSGGGEMMVSE